MLTTDQGQRARMIDYMEVHAPARSRELASIGVSGTTIARAVADGVVVRIGRAGGMQRANLACRPKASWANCAGAARCRIAW